MKKENIKAVICPPCGESVAGATKEGQNKGNALWPLLPRLTAVLPPQGREMNGGFTLIELLVVVLIIGILAAVAVPQYKMAVAKSQLTQGLVFVKAVGEAQEAFYLANGQYADSTNKLDISISCPDKLSCTTTQSITGVTFLSYSNLSIAYRYLHQEEIPEYQGLLYCACMKDKPEAVNICSHFGKKATRENPSNPAWDIYRIN